MSNNTEGTGKPKKEKHGSRNINILLIAVTILIIISFTFYDSPTRSGPIDGIRDFIANLKKTRIINDDGTITIPEDAPAGENREKPGTYIGKVLGEKITFGKNDLFNQNFKYIYDNKQLNPFQKYSYARQIFDESINRIIGVYNAKNVGIRISDSYKYLEIGKRYYKMSDGEINWKAMERDKATVTSLASDVVDSLLYENFLKDSFGGLPLSNNEMWDFYVMDNVKVSIDYVTLSNYNVADDKLIAYFNDNKNEYIKYKLTKIVFDSQKSSDAEKALEEIKADKSKFKIIGERLNSEKKIINMVTDTDFSFLQNIKDIELREELKGKNIGDIGSKVVKTEAGLVLFMVEEIKYPSFAENDIQSMVKNDYIKKYANQIEESNKVLAEKVFNYARQNGLYSAAKAFNLKVDTSSKALFMDPLPNLGDTTDDKNFTVNVFKSKKGEIVGPHKFSTGYMVCSIKEKDDISISDFESKFDGYAKRYVRMKEMIVEADFFKAERKKHEIVDNFNLVINYQTFFERDEIKK